MRRSHLGWILLVVLTGASGVVRAQAPAIVRPTPTSPAWAERQRAKAELDRVNAEIDKLKRENRGLGDDYRLRARMADAEALARRLTDLEARLPASARPAAPKGIPTSVAVPEPNPSDDRSVLEAKADVLADQARRLNSQADLLARRVGDLRDRNELRRRAGQLERDPFSALEQAKRRLASGASNSTQLGASDFGGAPTKTATDSTTNGTGSVGSNQNGMPPPASEGAATNTTTTIATTATTSTATSGVKVQPTLVAPIQASDSSGSVAMQFRGILDASTLAEIRRLETNGAPGASLSAMEHALAALRVRAAQLAAKASALRASAKTAP